MKKLLLFTAFVLFFSVNAQTPIQEFNFNGNLNNAQNNLLFFGTVKYVNDRAGIANSAVRINNNSIEATIPNLPLSNSERTVSIWIKYNDLATANYIWGYGSSYNAQFFGLLQQSATNSKSDLNLAGWGPGNDVIMTTTISLNTWYNYTVTYDGLTSKIYRNGELIKSSISPRKLTSGIVFRIGKMGNEVSMNADIDDLKIYNVALSSEEVAAIYNESSVLAPNDVVVSKNIKTYKGVLMKPNKATVVSSTASNIVFSAPKETMGNKIYEIYSTQGIKVFTGNKNEIDIATLPEGTYLLKLINSSENSVQKKLTVN